MLLNRIFQDTQTHAVKLYTTVKFISLGQIHSLVIKEPPVVWVSQSEYPVCLSFSLPSGFEPTNCHFGVSLLMFVDLYELFLEEVVEPLGLRETTPLSLQQPEGSWELMAGALFLLGAVVSPILSGATTSGIFAFPSSQSGITSLASNNLHSPRLPGSALCPAAYLGSRKLSTFSLPVGWARYLHSLPAG